MFACPQTLTSLPRPVPRPVNPAEHPIPGQLSEGRAGQHREHEIGRPGGWGLVWDHPPPRPRPQRRAHHLSPSRLTTCLLGQVAPGDSDESAGSPHSLLPQGSEGTPSNALRVWVSEGSGHTRGGLAPHRSCRVLSSWGFTLNTRASPAQQEPELWDPLLGQVRPLLLSRGSARVCASTRTHTHTHTWRSKQPASAPSGHLLPNTALIC